MALALTISDRGTSTRVEKSNPIFDYIKPNWTEKNEIQRRDDMSGLINPKTQLFINACLWNPDLMVRLSGLSFTFFDSLDLDFRSKNI